MSSGSPSDSIISNLDAIARARRLEELGIEIRSAELTEVAKSTRDFFERGGNRAMRRAAERQAKRQAKKR